MTNTFEYIVKKYKINVGRQYIVQIPNMGRNHLAALFGELKFTTGAEVGVFKGEYSEVLCKANPKLHLSAIDPWSPAAYEPGIPDGSPNQAYFNNLYKEAKNRLYPYNCTIVRKDSMTALKNFKDNSLDFVYIDANHDFVNFSSDLHFWTKKVKPGGIVSGHDYAFFPYRKFNHVKRALEAYAWSYHMIPLFIAGAETYNKKMTRDPFRSWFWVKA